MSEKDDKERGFKIVDRRFSSLDESELGDASPEAERKPEYVAQLESDLADRENRLQKIAASHESSVTDFQGARDRIRRETARDVERARRSLVVDFLDIIDNLDRAIEATEQTGDLATLLDGVKMVRDMFLGKLGALGIQRVDALGHHFDPSIHKAVTVVPADDPSHDGQIVQVIQEGYLMGEDIIRPASVAVARSDS